MAMKLPRFEGKRASFLCADTLLNEVDFPLQQCNLFPMSHLKHGSMA